MKNLFFAYALMFLVAYCKSATQKETTRKDSLTVITDTARSEADTTTQDLYFFNKYQISKTPIPESVTLSLRREKKTDENYLYLSGIGHINKYNSTYIENEKTGTIKNVEFIATRMAAADTSLMSAEVEFFKFMQGANKISVKGKEIKVYSIGNEVLTFSRDE
jgi:heat shock protein HslJ